MEREPKFETKLESGKDLFKLTPEEKQALAQRIEKWQGLVRLFVHPLFFKFADEKYFIQDPNKLNEIEKTLALLMTMEDGKTPPVIIMEEKKNIAKLRQWFIETVRSNSKNNPYILETITDDSTPAVGALSDIHAYEKKFPEEENVEDAWKKLCDLFAELGVKKILIAGADLRVNRFDCVKDWTGKGPAVDLCVGNAFNHLSKDKSGEFEVELSVLIHPTAERRELDKYLSGLEPAK